MEHAVQTTGATSNRDQSPRLITFDAPFYIACEGSADAAFLNQLLLSRGMSDESFFIRDMEGISKLEKHLTALQGSTDRSKLSYLAVVVDADLAPEERFREIQSALTNSQFPVPGEPFTIQQGSPSVGVWLMPGPGSMGNLETILIEATLQANPNYAACLKTFATCMEKPENWDVGKKAKMQINALIAGACAEDPSCSLTYVWGKPSNPIPRVSQRYDALAAFLENLSGLDVPPPHHSVPA